MTEKPDLTRDRQLANAVHKAVEVLNNATYEAALAGLHVEFRSSQQPKDGEGAASWLKLEAHIARRIPYKQE